MTVLEAEKLSVSFGAVRALTGLDLTVGAGELVGLIGPNGAGKTTALDALSGFVSASGTIRLQGRDISRSSPSERARTGLARTWQTVDLFEGMTIRENLQVVAEQGGLWRMFSDLVRRRGTDRRVDAALATLGIEQLAERFPENLSNGERKLAGVARALAGSPTVLMLDEPAAGLDSTESLALGATLRQLVDGGLSMLLVEHDMGMVLGICDRIYVLDSGRLIAQGTPAQIQRDPAVLASYLGSTDEQEIEQAEAAIAETVAVRGAT